MNREETLALYEKAQKEGIHVWNDWANEMLAEKEKLKEAGEWEEKRTDWEERATADFSSSVDPYTFEEIADFENFIFPALTSFNGANFSSHVYFINSTFREQANFNNTIFKDHTIFHKTLFCREADFNGVSFNGPVTFHSASFNQNASFLSATFKGYASFQRVQFKRLTNFNAIHANRSFAMDFGQYKSHIPNFTQAHFEEAPRLGKIEICPPPKVKPRYPWCRYFWEKKLGRAYKAYEQRLFNRWIKYPLAQFTNARRQPEEEAKYRALKRLAIQAHDHENEQKFWAGEIRARRHIKDCINPFKKGPASTVRYIGGVLYGLLSDFGRSIWRPFVAWMALIALMTCVHLSAHDTMKNQPPVQDTARLKYPPQTERDCDPTWAAVHVALKTSALGLGFDRTKSDVYKDHYRCLYPSEKATLKIPNRILIYEVLQMLGSAILIFLLLLGIRNNFKLK